MEDAYTKLTQKFLQDMAAVGGPIEEYLVSLRDAIGEIEVAIDAGEQDINQIAAEVL